MRVLVVLLALTGCLAPPSRVAQMPLYQIVEPVNRNAGAIKVLATDGQWHLIAAEQ